MKWIFFSVSCLFAHPDLSITLESLAGRIRENPSAYALRADRAWLMLDHGSPDGTVPEDIDSLSPHPDWSGHAARLSAYRLFVLGKNAEAKLQILENLRNKKTDGPEQLKLLAQIELASKDTSASINAWNRSWEKRHEEEDFLAMIALYRARKQAPFRLLEAGWRRFPHSPGMLEGVYSNYWTAGGRENLKRCLKISISAVSLWPRSVDWKIRNAKALMGTGQGKKAEARLLEALELLDDSLRLDPNANTTAEVRKDIFTMLESIKKGVP